ncbi:transmembrane protein [Perilla frutescens var. frutescens]|nr:transmembrane protein [Perilla frutescens var. frutescens]
METSAAASAGDGVDGFYKPLPPLYFAFMVVWVLSAASWTFNTYKNRHFQPNKLQWMLASVPWIKALQLSFSFLFWYTCFYSNVCSLWMSFGVYIMGVLFQTCAFVSFFLISHGYCITCHRLSLSERRTMAVLASVFYLTLVGYRASVPYFSLLLLINYVILFYVIFNHVSQNINALSDQLRFINNQDVQAMHDAVYTKYIMFKKFQGAMQIVAVSEFVMFISLDNSLESYWIRLLVREWAQFFIFLFIGWIFRSQQLAPRFSVMPVLRAKGETVIPPIYSIEMDAESFKEFRCHEWHIGVPTLGSMKESVLVVIQQPHSYSLVSKS